MNKEAIIERLCSLPNDFHKLGNVPSIALVERSGYLEMPGVLTQENIRSYLEQHPSLVAEWLQWSDNQRCSPAWVFGKGTTGNFLYRMPANGVDLVFENEFEACAEFIVRWVSSGQLSKKRST